MYIQTTTTDLDPSLLLLPFSPVLFLSPILYHLILFFPFLPSTIISAHSVSLLLFLFSPIVPCTCSASFISSPSFTCLLIVSNLHLFLPLSSPNDAFPLLPAAAPLPALWTPHP